MISRPEFIPPSDLSQPATPFIDMEQEQQNDGSQRPRDPAPQSESTATIANWVASSPDGVDNDEGPPKVGARFSSRSVRILRNWFADHESHPYPSPKDVEMLQIQTGLSGQQITNWFGNFRRRYKFRALRPVSPDVLNWVEPSSNSQGPINIPPRRPTPAPMEHMDPLQRWENSPPQHEAAAVSDISRAVAASAASPSTSAPARPWSGRSAGTASSTHPDEGVLCAYCGDVNPDQNHLKKHNTSTCLERPFEERTFYRKDHLRQHLKLVHSANYIKWPMETWRSSIEEIRSRCGFCGIEMESWSSRTNHLASHFKGGRTMADWTGDWGFEPSVIDMLDNAIPPYLIHYEKNSPLPFSALAGPADTPSSAYELIKLEWEYYMRGYHDLHTESLSDEKMQYDACLIIFGAEAISEGHPSSAPSWLRDLLMANHDIAEQARIQPMNQLTKSRMSPLKINGKKNIFESCELEGSLCRYIGMHISLGLQLSDHELQQEACHAISRLEIPSPNPSRRFMEFLGRLIWDSKEWLAPLKERGRLHPEREMADQGSHLLHMAHLGSVMGQTYPIDPQLEEFLPGGLPNLLAGLEQSGAIPASLFCAQPSMQSFAEPPPSYWAPTMSRSTFNSSHLNPPINSTPVTPFFLNDNNSYRRLTRELSRFVVSCMSPNDPNSHVPSDEELKYQARWIPYDDDDPWNQAPVDNVEWLNEFKKSVGLSVVV
ncbi:hypothetical protein CDV31_001629 [Fusarium ambrosium]|uniref:Homeobox domain-containing protein n=1 Tax=Fusarium ambrosium TaxID=131363 RepID=A0A428UYU6_9HYPO|nr:hypothetical protein CDV31_001629 [Fusarium ambrosium]